MFTLNHKDFVHDHPNTHDGPMHQVWKLLREQRKDGCGCDTTVKCGSQEFYAHRVVLAGVSAYFKTYLYGLFNQTPKEGNFTVSLENFSVSSVKLVLNLIYEEPQIDEAEIDLYDLLHLLDYLQMDSYFDLLIANSLRSHITMDNCMHLFHISQQYNAKRLLELLSIYIGYNVFSLLEVEQWKALTCSNLKVLLEYDAINCFPLKILSKVVKQVCCDEELISLTENDGACTLLKRINDGFHVDRKYETVMIHGSNSATENRGLLCLTSKPAPNLNNVFPKSILRNHDFFYFSCRGQLHVAYSQADVTPPSQMLLAKYDHVTREYQELLKESIPRYDHILQVYVDIKESFIYIVCYLYYDMIFDTDVENWSERPICTLKVNADTYFVEDRIYLTDESDKTVKLFDDRCSKMYFFEGRQLSAYSFNTKIETKLEIRKTLRKEDDLNIYVMHNGNIFMFSIHITNLHVKKFNMSRKKMDNFSSHTLLKAPCQIRGYSLNKSVHLYLFYTSNSTFLPGSVLHNEGHLFCDVMKFNSSNKEIVIISQSDIFFGPPGRIVDVPDYLLDKG